MIDDNNFVFGGKHCLNDYDCIYVRTGARQISAPQKVSSYKVGGVEGTVAYGDRIERETYTMTGTLYAMHRIRSETEAMQLGREIAKWLLCGRRPLIWDSEQKLYIMAEVTNLDYDAYDWIEGGIGVTWLCQPGLWSLHPTEVRKTLTSAGSVNVLITPDTVLPAPLSIDVTNTGTAVIRTVQVDVGGKQVKINKAMYLTAGETLHISMEPPVGVSIDSADGTTRSGMRHVATFEGLEIATTSSVGVVMSYGSGTTQTAGVILRSRGRWR